MTSTKRGRPRSVGDASTTTKISAPPKEIKKFTKGKSDAPRGEKIIIYGPSGIGKSSLVAMAPKPIIIPLDDGSANLRDPFTNEPIEQVQECYTYADTRAAMQQYSLYDDSDTVIVDTVTKLQDLSHQYMFDTIPHEKGPTKIVTSIEGYGYGKGYSHLYDVMKLILQDADELVRRGKNVIFIAQNAVRNVPNAAGEDYLCNSVRLYPGSKNLPPVSDLYIEWADHLLFINHANSVVTDKKIKGDATRAVFTQGELHFRAKTRVLASGTVIPPVVTFEDLADDSIWQYLFEEGVSDVQTDTVPPEAP